jgi:hypothetical protein
VRFFLYKKKVNCAISLFHVLRCEIASSDRIYCTDNWHAVWESFKFRLVLLLYRCLMILKIWVLSVIMNTIIDNQRDVLLSVQGTNIWSGQQPQQYNSQAIAWGGLRFVFFQLLQKISFSVDSKHSHELFAVGKRYQFVVWAYLIGLVVPVPFWIMYKLWPKLRTDYLYTPMIWYGTTFRHLTPPFFDL